MSIFNRVCAIKNLLMIQKLFGIGTARADKFYRQLSNLNLLDAPDMRKCTSKITIPDSIKSDFETLDYAFAEKVIKLCADNKIEIIIIEDKKYPERLRNIPVPPLVLFIKGELPDVDTLPLINIVGPRKVSHFGAKAAYSLALRLTKSGMIVVSGAALGCDSYAHKGALRVGGKTIAVLGCGLLSDYLPKNRKLRKIISENGCLISEYPPKTDASKYTFPVRNRIMSGLSLGTVVIEAGEKSGALITARHANEQGRDVFVIPGNPTYANYKGSNKLLRDGAKPLLDASDIFNEYIFEYAGYIDIEKAFEKTEVEKKSKKIIKKSTISLSNEAKIVYNYLDKQIFTADELLATGISYDDILSALTELEFEHLIEALPGGNYKLV